jgi:hypothetical protein
MDKLCLVFDLDETVLHYVDRATEEFINEDMSEEPNDNQNENEVKNLIRPGDKVLFRPGFWKFIEYVKSKQGQIVLGIWTFGNRDYADKLKPLLERSGDLYRFVYTRDDMKKGMLDKQLTYVVNKFDKNMRKHLGIQGRRTRSKRSTTELPKNIFLIDNLYTNIDHNINRKNGILVESFVDSNKPDTMFEELETICESLLSDGKIPSEYMQNFKINGKKRVIASIGAIFDGGITPIESSLSFSTRSKTQSGGNKTLKAMKAMNALDIMLRKNKIKTQRLNL